MTPRVSVIMASYNYARYLPEAIESVLRQTFAQWELLIVDDGSTDNSREIAAAYARQDARVRLLVHADNANHGLPATLRRGLAEAAGAYVAFLESDDAWLPESLEEKVRALDTFPEAGLAFSDVLSFGGEMREPLRRLLERLRREVWKPAVPQSYAAAYPRDNIIPTFSCCMARASLLRACHWDSPQPLWLDWWLWGQCACLTKFCFLPAPATCWRIHGSHNGTAAKPVPRARFVRALGRKCLARRVMRWMFVHTLACSMPWHAGSKGQTRSVCS